MDKWVRISSKKIWTGIFVFFVGGVIWTAATEKPKPIEPDSCERLRTDVSPISTRLRVVRGTSEQQYLECARKHDQALVKIDRFVRKTDGATEDEIDKFARHALSEEELIRLSKMTQEERDREDCQRFNAVWESKFKKPFKDSALDRSPQHHIS